MINLLKKLSVFLVIMFVLLSTAQAQENPAGVTTNRGPVLIQLDFAYKGPFGKEMSDGLIDLAKSITQEPGFIWKVWTENGKEHEAGGIYLFENEQTAQAYVNKHTARLKNFGINKFNLKMFDVNVPLTRLTKGVLETK